MRCKKLGKKFGGIFNSFFNKMPKSLCETIKNQKSKFIESDRSYKKLNNIDDRNYRFIADKFIGDEIILKSCITSFNSIPIIILGLRQAIKEYRIELYKEDKRLDLKATMWLAQCPLINNKVQIIYSNDNNAIWKFDCLGPSMDVGFRLAKYSTENFITISIEVAYILGKLSEETLELFGRESIKIKYYKSLFQK